MAQNQIDALTDKLTMMKVKKDQMKESNDTFKMQLCEVTNEKTMWKYGGLVALAVSWIWFTFVLSGK